MGENSTGEAAEVQAGASNPVPPGVPAMGSYFGRMDAFNSKGEKWMTYVERLEMIFAVNNRHRIHLSPAKIKAILEVQEPPPPPPQRKLSYSLLCVWSFITGSSFQACLPRRVRSTSR